MPTSAASPPIRRISTALVAAGIALRVVLFFFIPRPLGHDESLLSINILTRSLAGLLSPLDGNQVAPLGFLWAERIVTHLGGPDEVALRLIPFVAGLVALILFARLAQRMLDPGPALMATALAALSPFFIHYAVEVKSSELDALMAVVLAHIALDFAEEGSAKQARRLALAGAVTVLFSGAAPFIVGGCAIALVLVPRIHRDRGALLRLAAASAAAAVIFVMQFLALNRGVPLTSSADDYSADAFLQPQLVPAIKGLASVVREFWSSVLFGTVESHLPAKSLTVMVVLSAVGCIALFRRSRLYALLLLAPFALAVIASLAQLRPLSPGLLLFVAPAVWITVAAGLAAAARLAPARARTGVFAAGALVVVVASGVGAVAELRDPYRHEAVPQGMSEIAQGLRGGATVYISAEYAPACRYYAALHSRRAAFASDTTVRDCSVRDARLVVGTKRERDPNARPTAFGEPAVSAAWVDAEVERIVKTTTGDLWIMDQRALDGTDVLQPALERAGAVRVARTRYGRIVVDRYRLGAAGTGAL